jgi:hypothetical protein
MKARLPGSLMILEVATRLVKDAKLLDMEEHELPVATPAGFVHTLEDSNVTELPWASTTEYNEAKMLRSSTVQAISQERWKYDIRLVNVKQHSIQLAERAKIMSR